MLLLNRPPPPVLFEVLLPKLKPVELFEVPAFPNKEGLLWFCVLPKSPPPVLFPNPEEEAPPNGLLVVAVLLLFELPKSPPVVVVAGWVELFPKSPPEAGLLPKSPPPPVLEPKAVEVLDEKPVFVVLEPKGLLLLVAAAAPKLPPVWLEPKPPPKFVAPKAPACPPPLPKRRPAL